MFKKIKHNPAIWSKDISWSSRAWIAYKRKKVDWEKVCNFFIWILFILAGLTILLPGIIWNIKTYL